VKDMKIDLDALRQIEREKSIDFHTVVEAFETALASAYKRSAMAAADEARVSVDRVTGDVTLYAQELDDEGNVISEWQEKPKDFGRIVAQTAKQVLLQRLREAEREATYGEYVGREGDIVSGTVSQQGNVTLIEMGRTEALLPYPEQIPNERLGHGQHTRAVVTEVRKQLRGAQIVASRTHPALVVGLFALEVPEIEEGIVEIKGIAREAGTGPRSRSPRTTPTWTPWAPAWARVASAPGACRRSSTRRSSSASTSCAGPTSPRSWWPTPSRRRRSPASSSTRTTAPPS
jgi:transcription termination/antitermination protein NusA